MSNHDFSIRRLLFTGLAGISILCCGGFMGYSIANAQAAGLIGLSDSAEDQSMENQPNLFMPDMDEITGRDQDFDWSPEEGTEDFDQEDDSLTDFFGRWFFQDENQDMDSDAGKDPFGNGETYGRPGQNDGPSGQEDLFDYFHNGAGDFKSDNRDSSRNSQGMDRYFSDRKNNQESEESSGNWQDRIESFFFGERQNYSGQNDAFADGTYSGSSTDL